MVEILVSVVVLVIIILVAMASLFLMPEVLSYGANVENVQSLLTSYQSIAEAEGNNFSDLNSLATNTNYYFFASGTSWRFATGQEQVSLNNSNYTRWFSLGSLSFTPARPNNVKQLNLYVNDGNQTYESDLIITKWR
ncbi:MAG: hypothetical protein M1505_01550 [Patescibacteria group bacterium]|nr:hypothetical protein [Patescibacteria group bacterium]MCL5257898.1 hypothetical protein [Patescibacteria group bacterium]